VHRPERVPPRTIAPIARPAVGFNERRRGGLGSCAAPAIPAKVDTVFHPELRKNKELERITDSEKS